MRITTLTAGLVASLALIAAPLGAMDNDHQTVGDRNAKVLEKVPMKARDALIKEADGREITSVDRKEDNGKVVYQAKIKREGPDLRLKVDEDGKVVWRSDEGRAGGSQSGGWGDRTRDRAERDIDKMEHKTHDAVKLDDVPPAAREALTREADGHELRDLDRSTKGGKTIYEAEVDLGNGKQREIKVDEDGKVLKSHED